MAPRGEADPTPPKTYGIPDGGEAGKGEEIKGDDLVMFNIARGLLDPLIITIKGGKHFDGHNISEGLRKMLEEHRIGKGKGATWNDKTKVRGGTWYPASKGKTGPPLTNISSQMFRGNVPLQELAAVLAHEYVHTQQTWTKDNEHEREIEAHQVSVEVWKLLVQVELEEPTFRESEERAVEEHKHPERQLSDSWVPDNGSWRGGSRCGHEYVLLQSPGRLYWLADTTTRDSVVAAPGQAYFDVVTFDASAGCERLLIFGSDLSDPQDPVGTLTIVDADTTGFVFRRDSVLSGLKLPFAAARDTVAARLFVLDAHVAGAGLVRLEDTDGDSIPDHQPASSFAPRTFEGVDSALSVHWARHPVHGVGVELSRDDVRSVDSFGVEDSVAFVADADDDGVADQSHAVPRADFLLLPPLFIEPLVPALTQAHLVAMGGHLIRIVATDSTADEALEVLGSGAATATGEELIVSLSRPLVEGEFLAALDLTDSLQLGSPTRCAAITAAAPRESVRPECRLGRVRPNPLRGASVRAAIPYELDRAARVKLRIFDVAGRVVRTLEDCLVEPGAHTAAWDGRDSRGNPVHAGTYYASLESGRTSQARVIVRLP